MPTRQRARTGFRIKAAVAAAALAALALVAPAGAQQERMAIRGTSVTLTPPPGFTAARAARTIENTATGTSIMISETSAQGYAELAERFSSAKALSEGYAQQKVTIRSVRRIDGKIPFAVGRQAQASGQEIPKYYGLLQGDKTVLVTFTVGRGGFTEADAEAVLRSIEIAPEPTLEEKLADIPFTFRAVEPYVVKQVIPRQAVQLEAEGGPERPVVVIGFGRSQAMMGDEARVAVQLLHNTGGYREAQIAEQGPTAFAGGNGYLVKAVVEDRTALQYLRILPGGTYLRLLARGKTSGMAGVEAAIAEMAGSVEPR
jgi:hypothetical protein